MEFKEKNYLHMSDTTRWRCMLHNISKEGTVELMVLPDPPSRSRMHIQFVDAIYVDMYAGWRELSLNVATRNELVDFLPSLGSHLRKKMTDEYIIDNYKLFVFSTNGKDKLIVARDCMISQVLP